MIKPNSSDLAGKHLNGTDALTKLALHECPWGILALALRVSRVTKCRSTGHFPNNDKHKRSTPSADRTVLISCKGKRLAPKP